MSISACFGCRKCTAGCPLTFAMDIAPDALIRLVQLGARERVLSSATPWVCASCQTCLTRCPNGIELPALMDALKQLAAASGVEPPEGWRKAALMQRLFLGELKRRGRIHELALLTRYKLGAGGLAGEFGLGWKMLLRGRLRLLPPPRPKGLGEVRALFAEAPLP